MNGAQSWSKAELFNRVERWSNRPGSSGMTNQILANRMASKVALYHPLARTEYRPRLQLSFLLSKCFHLNSSATLASHQLSEVWSPLMLVSRQQLLCKCASVLGSFLGRWQMLKELWVRRQLSRPHYPNQMHLQKPCRLRQRRPTQRLPTSLLQRRHPKSYRRRWSPSFHSHSPARYLTVDTGLHISSRRGHTRKGS